MAVGIYRMGAIYYKICIDSYEVYLLECFTSPLTISLTKSLRVAGPLLWVWPPFFLGFVITVALHVESNIYCELKCSLNATNTDFI